MLAAAGATLPGCYQPDEGNGRGPELADDSGTTDEIIEPSETGPDTSISASAEGGPVTSGGDSASGPGRDDGTGSTSGEAQGETSGGESTTGESASEDGSSESTTEVAPPPERIVLFGSDPVGADIEAAGGQADARASADALCAASLDNNFPAVQCTSVHAVLSITDDDEVADMAANYGIPGDIPVEGTTGVFIDDDFSALLDNDVQVDLSDANVFPGAVGNTDFWSGSTSDGHKQGNLQCEGWTSRVGGGTNIGITGHPSYSDHQWLSWGFANCDEERPLLCLCW